MRRAALAAGAIACAGVALAFAAVFSHASRVFAVDHLAGTEHHEVLVELSAATQGERVLLAVGALLVVGAVVTLAAAWVQRRRVPRRLADR